jgi:hypothetical protein
VHAELIASPPAWAAVAPASLTCLTPSAVLNTSRYEVPLLNTTADTVQNVLSLALNMSNSSGAFGSNGTNFSQPNVTNPAAPPAPSTPAVSTPPSEGVLPPSAFWPDLPRRVLVEVSPNGVDFSISGGDAPLFSYLAPPLDLPLPRPPNGPVDGGTLLNLTKVPTSGMVSAFCRFGDAQPVVATRNTAVADLVQCRTPPAAEAGVEIGHVAISISLDGQQYSPTSATFKYDKVASVMSILPDISPDVGGLIVELSGEHLSGGSEYTCRFDSISHVRATYDDESGTVLCVSPPGLLGEVRVSASLNAQQYSVDDEAILTYYNVDALDTLLPYGSGAEAPPVSSN